MRMRPIRPPPRERILQAAQELFSTEGLRRVTVDAVAERANTTKMAVYRHFASKEALVGEWLAIVIAQYAGELDRLAREHPVDARAQLTGWVRFVSDSLPRLSYRGCPFVNSLAELPDREDPARQQIERHKARQTNRITRLCIEAGLPEPEIAATHLIFLLEGAQVTVQNDSVDEVQKRLLIIIGQLLDSCS